MEKIENIKNDNIENIEEESKKELSLTELIDVEILQEIQDSFSNLTGLAALTADVDGSPVTAGSNFSNFCMEYVRKSKKGYEYCKECDKKGGELTLEKGAACFYTCHAGLIDFAAPIMANGKIVGSFIGGQVLPNPPDLDKFRKIAKDLDIDEEKLIESVKKIRVVEKEKIDSSAKFLYSIANILSTIAYNGHQLYINNLEIQKASRMKSDFLANMSHEIRTPMNAVLGMAEIALQEEMSPTAKECIHQIKASGKALLAIINDILDFSKIESGKMEIINTEYEPLSIFNDIVNVVMTRIGTKKIDFLMDIPDNMPYKLYGDNIRISQILINLLTNAVKFTKEGYVYLKTSFDFIDENNIMLKISVQDTGKGIKTNDLDKLFTSFQQVDSKRNRNIEGTGLGLAITKQLLNIMGGKISVESKYGKGSTFTFELPQKIEDKKAAISKAKETINVGIILEDCFIKPQIFKDLEKLDVNYTEINNLDNISFSDFNYILVDEKLFSDELRDSVSQYENTKFILITDYYNRTQWNIKNLVSIRKPIYILNLVSALGICVPHINDSSDYDIFNFTAPDAEILIVDDNTINLKVAKGLLEPFKMKIDSATGAKEAIDLISKKQYDLIFMDHMMPEVDGVETTHIIRRLFINYKNTPIIALTANAVSGVKKMFIQEGMNDFISKPIDIKIIAEKLKMWLPSEKVIHSDYVETAPAKKKDILVADLDTKFALSLLGTEELFWSVLKEYYSVIDKKASLIKAYKHEELWKDYTIEVHALKSSSKQIGAISLSEKAAKLETAGNAKDIDYINANTDDMLNEYLAYKESLSEYFPEEEEESIEISEEVLKEFFKEMNDSIDSFDSLQMDETLSKIEKYIFPDEWKKYVDSLRDAVDNDDIEECENLLEQWSKEIA